MTDTKIPMRIFTSYEALTEYYGERPDMELGLYVSDEKLLVGHAPTAYSFNPQYFTGENELEPNYVPASPIDYTINVAPNDTTYGYATGGGTYPEHTEITVNAYAYYGYKFDKWSNDVDTSAYTFAVEEDADLTAYFVDNTYTVTTKPSAPGIGTTTGDGVYIAGTSVTVTATPAEGCYFADAWFDTDTSQYVSTDAEYTFTVDKNTNLMAIFAHYLTVSATPNNSDYGSTTGSGQYKGGAYVTVTATPNENYRFVNWTENGTEVSTDAEYTFNVYDDTALVANFALITYTVTVSANDSSYGTVTGGGEYARGSNVTINAIPNSGYNFVNWTQGGIQVVTHPEYTFTILSDADFVANFENPYLEPFYVENITNENETLTIDKMRESSLPSSGDPSPDITVEYSTDKTTWTTFGTTTFAGPALTMSLNPGDKVYLRANTTRWGTNDNSVKIYNNITGISRVGGNIMSLLYGSNFTGQEKTFRDTIGFDFYRVFYQNIVLLDSSKLICPAETLYTRSYVSMFAKCPNLVTSPILDFTNMIASQSGQIGVPDGACCGWMFENDTSLVNVPELKSTITVKDCYNGMFKGCTSLATAPELLATTLDQTCYKQMFYGCTSLTSAPALPATTMLIECYKEMFWGCTSLTTAPELPATTLANNCYNAMFKNCTSLTAAPELPATTLVNGCYREMFYGCTSLNTIKCLATSGITTSILGQWVNTVSSTGTFIKVTGVEYSTGNSGIPTGWTVVEEPVS